MLMNKPVYLDLSMLQLSKIATYEFWYDYVKPKYQEKLCYMDTNIVCIETDDIAEDVELRCDTSNYELDRLLPQRKNIKVIRLMKVELSRKIKNELSGLRAKTYSYLIDNVSQAKKYNTLVSGNAGNKKNLHPGSSKKNFFINLTEFLKIKFRLKKLL